jgi:hypothetical protein
MHACMHLGVLEESTNNMEKDKIPAFPSKRNSTSAHKINQCKICVKIFF